MKSLFTFLVLAFFFTNVRAQDIDATLGGNTSNEGFSVKDDGSNTLFRVNGLGKVGIGTTTPANILTIETSGTGIGTDTSHQIRIQDDHVNKQELKIGVNSAGLYSYLQSSQTNVGHKSLVLNPLGGNVGVGTISPTHALDVETSGTSFAAVIRSTSTAGNGLAVRVENAQSGNAFDIASIFGQVFNVDAGGVVKGNYGTYHAPSDVRLKKDISTIPDALSKVMGLRGVTFKWKDPQRDQSMQMGLIAQEVEKVVPEVVHTADDEMKTKSVEYQYLVGLLIEAVKDQQKQIEFLEGRINAIASKESDVESLGYVDPNKNNFENVYSVQR